MLPLGWFESVTFTNDIGMSIFLHKGSSTFEIVPLSKIPSRDKVNVFKARTSSLAPREQNALIIRREGTERRL